MTIMMAIAMAMAYGVSFFASLMALTGGSEDRHKNSACAIAAICFGMGTLFLLAFIDLIFGPTA